MRKQLNNEVWGPGTPSSAEHTQITLDRDGKKRRLGPPRRSNIDVGRGETFTGGEKQQSAGLVARKAKTLHNHLGMELKPELQIRRRPLAEQRLITNGNLNEKEDGLCGRIDRGPSRSA